MPQIYLEIDASGAVKGIKQYSRATTEGEKATNKLTGSTKKAESAVEGIAAKLVGAAGAVISVSVAVQKLKASLNIFAEFDDKMRIAASYARATTEEFGLMSRAAAQAGATTSKTASDAAQGLAEFAARGFTVKEQLEALVPAIRLAEAAQVSIGRATEVSAGIMRGYGKDVSELERINDIIVGISGASAANLNFVGDAAKYAIPAARAVGEEFETVAAILGTLANQMFEAGQSGNAMKTFMIALSGPTNKAQAALDRLGVSTRDSKGEFLGLIPIFEQFKKAGLGLVDSKDIFGRFYATAGLAVAKTIDDVKDNIEFLKYEVDGLTESTAEFQQAGLGGSFRKLGSAVEAVYIAVGGQLAPIVQDVTKDLAKYAGNASKAANATSLLVGGARLLANSFGVLHTFARGINIVLGETVEWVYKTVSAFNQLTFITGISKAFGFNIDASGAIDEIERFNDIQEDGFGKALDNFGKVNKRFDEYQRKVKENLVIIHQQKAAQGALTKASEGAATAAGKQAIAAGKSTQEALGAAEAARKAYLITAKAAKEQESTDNKSIATAEKKRIALEKQAKSVKEQALSYGATSSAAQKAADKVLEAGEAADGITGKGPDNLNKSLDQTATIAGVARTALARMGDVGLPSGYGDIKYSVGLSTGDYDRKVTYLKESVRSLNNEYQVKINFDTEGAEQLKKELDSTRKELENTQAIKGYNEQLRGLQSEYGKVHKFFLDRKLEIVIDRTAEANLRGQINAVNDLKFSVDGVIPGLERVDGVWKQIPVSVAAAVEPAVAGLGQFVNTAGEIETTWNNIDGVWTEVLPNGVLLVEEMNGTLSAGTEIAYGYGAAVAGAAQAASGSISPVEKALEKVEDQIYKTQDAAGSLKFDKLATQTGAFNAVTNEIEDLRKSLKDIDPASAEAEAGIKRLLSLDAIKSQLSKNISGLKKEIYDTGEESKKTGDKAAEAAAKIARIPKETKAAASAVEELAKANAALVQSEGDIARAAWGAGKTFELTSANTIEGINAEIEKTKEFQRAVEHMNDIIFNNADFAGINYSAQDLQQQKIQNLEARKFELKRDNTISNFAGAGGNFTIGAQSPIVNNFYGMDRSDSVDVIKEAERQQARA